MRKFIWHYFCTGVFLVVFGLTGCETATAVKESVKPQNFEETLVSVKVLIGTLRMTANILAPTGALSDDLLVEIDKQTIQANNDLNLLRTAYVSAGGDLAKCEIVYEGVSLPCENRQDQILSILTKLEERLRNESRQRGTSGSGQPSGAAFTGRQTYRQPNSAGIRYNFTHT